MKNFVYKIIIAVLLGVALLLFFKSCEKDNMINDLEDAIETADLKNQKFETTINEKNQEITEQKQVILTKDQAIKSGLLDYADLQKKYKNHKTKVQIVTETKFDTIKVPFEPDTSNVVLPPFQKMFKYQDPDKWIGLGGTVTNLGVNFDSISVRNKYSILIADKKLMKSKPSVILTNENPYTKTVEMNNVQIKQVKPFYKKEWFWFVLGVAGKTVIDSKL